MKYKQSGMTLTSFVVVLAVVGFFAYIGMKLFPMYMEYYAVRSAMKGLAAEAGSADMDPAQAKLLLFRRLDISYSGSVQPDDVKFDRIDSGWKMHVAYEVRKPLLANLDVVGKFDITQDLTTRGGE
ncbi:DUF4845 domain-containing protein [Xanthomonas theicola]|uniref:DUF4845 domain-containing protein n=1 Tax=Xanthomonas theicola TaxID=56464 RepID=A0A2S6ZEG7_9XANT|nr:DUF4845 domain-containing protein [Xanthomonas theicola]PPT90550.1 DUF4845 domain-containing protein [Xanthomonas theicola]QNH24760.1 DUF4845 domain-containing protein [Xanthomonas theicola]